jgi:DNA-binding GntR family transcriptional regulator
MDSQSSTETPSRTKIVYDALLRQIIAGEIRQGEFLSEVRLSQHFQTSRTPVREACIHLYKEGFLRVAPHKGYVVTEISLEETRELYCLRQVLEPEAASLAALNDQGAAFFAACGLQSERRLELLAGERTYEAFLELGKLEFSFHHGIALASGNRKMAKFIAEIMNQFRRFHFVCFRKSPWLESSIDEHHEILSAIESRDAARARQLMYDHITRGAERGFQLILAELAGGSANGIRI